MYGSEKHQQAEQDESEAKKGFAAVKAAGSASNSSARRSANKMSQADTDDEQRVGVRVRQMAQETVDHTNTCRYVTANTEATNHGTRFVRISRVRVLRVN